MAPPLERATARSMGRGSETSVRRLNRIGGDAEDARQDVGRPDRDEAIVALVPTSAAAAWWATPSPPMAATTSAPEAMALRTVASTPPAADGQRWSTSYRLRRMPVTRRRASPLKPDAAGLARMASLTRSAPRWQGSRPGRGAGDSLEHDPGDQHVHRQQTEGGETAPSEDVDHQRPQQRAEDGGEAADGAVEPVELAVEVRRCEPGHIGAVGRPGGPSASPPATPTTQPRSSRLAAAAAMPMAMVAIHTARTPWRMILGPARSTSHPATRPPTMALAMPMMVRA